MNIAKAAKKLRIKIPTAKVILTNYRKKGRIFKKKKEERVETPKSESKTPVIKEEVVEEKKVEVEEQTCPYSPVNFYPFLYWNTMTPVPSFLMF